MIELDVKPFLSSWMQNPDNGRIIVIRPGNMGYFESVDYSNPIRLFLEDIVIVEEYASEDWDRRTSKTYYNLMEKKGKLELDKTAGKTIATKIKKSFIKFVKAFKRIPKYCVAANFDDLEGEVVFDLEDFLYFKFKIKDTDFRKEGIDEYLRGIPQLTSNLCSIPELAEITYDDKSEHTKKIKDLPTISWDVSGPLESDEAIVTALTPKVEKKKTFIYSSPAYKLDFRGVVTHLRPGKYSIRKLRQYQEVFGTLKWLKVLEINNWPYPILPTLPPNVERLEIWVYTNDYEELIQNGKLTKPIKALAEFIPQIPSPYAKLQYLDLGRVTFDEKNNFNVPMPVLETLSLRKCNFTDWKYVPQNCPNIKKLVLRGIDKLPAFISNFPLLEEVILEYTTRPKGLPLELLNLPPTLKKFEMEAILNENEKALIQGSFSKLWEYLEEREGIDWRKEEVLPEDLH